MAAPTNLPSWRDVNRIVVRSLAVSAASAVGEPLAARAADLILARHEQEKLPPEYQAQVLAEFLHDRYFEVLRHLDSDHPNPTHLAIALEYRHGEMPAPMVTARGSGELAQRMRDEARRHGIPIVEHVPLARALFALEDTDVFVPEEHFNQVARLLRWVYSARAPMKPRTSRP